jgi:cobalamin synthase
MLDLYILQALHLEEVDTVILLVDFLVEFQVIILVRFKELEAVGLDQMAMAETDQMPLQVQAELLEVVLPQTLALVGAEVGAVVLALVVLVALVGPDKLQSFGWTKCQNLQANILQQMELSFAHLA